MEISTNITMKKIGVLITCWPKRVNQSIVNLKLLRFYNSDLNYEVVFVENGGFPDDKLYEILKDYPEVKMIVWNKDNLGLQRACAKSYNQGFYLLKGMETDISISLCARTWILKNDWIKTCCDGLNQDIKLLVDRVHPVKKRKGFESRIFIGYTDTLNDIFSNFRLTSFMNRYGFKEEVFEQDFGRIAINMGIGYGSLKDTIGFEVNHNYDMKNFLELAIRDGCNSKYIKYFAEHINEIERGGL